MNNMMKALSERIKGRESLCEEHQSFLSVHFFPSAEAGELSVAVAEQDAREK